MVDLTKSIFEAVDISLRLIASDMSVNVKVMTKNGDKGGGGVSLKFWAQFFLTV